MTPLKPILRKFIYAFLAALVATTAQAEAPNMPDDPQTTRVSLRERKGRPLKIIGLNSVDGFMRQILKVDPELKTFANLPKGSDWKQADVFVVFVDDIEKISTRPSALRGAWEWGFSIQSEEVSKYVEFTTENGDHRAVMFVLLSHYKTLQLQKLPANRPYPFGLAFKPSSKTRIFYL